MKKVILMMLAIMFLGTMGYAKGSGTEDKSKSADGVEAVDLGLSVKWANMNVGAKKASGYGTYFAWGETQPKEYYSWNTYVWSRGDSQFLTKYSTIDRKIQLTPADDAAHNNWGGEWRMPTVDEFEELIMQTRSSVLLVASTGHHRSILLIPTKHGVWNSISPM